LEQWADIIGLRRINNDDALALLELADEMVAVQGGQHGDDDGHEEPEPRQAITLREKLGRVETPPGNARRRIVAVGVWRGLSVS